LFLFTPFFSLLSSPLFFLSRFEMFGLFNYEFFFLLTVQGSVALCLFYWGGVCQFGRFATVSEKRF